MSTAVVFAYHNVGVRCLSVLLAHGVEVQLVLTHEDDAKEHIWFDSVKALAAREHLRCATPNDVNTPEWLAQLRMLKPDFIFSFYYRNMLKAELLDCATRGAYNMHGSLLPKYRGRVPVNWAVLHGERETGATLHQMVTKPDAGDIVGQTAIPILPNDTAFDVFQKVTVAAELTLDKALPSLLDGSAKLRAQDLSQGAYFSGRKPEDGRIDWQQSATRIHNLVRAVAPPYPGAFTEVQSKRLRVLRTRVLTQRARHPGACLYWDGYHLRADLHDGSVLALLEVEHAGALLDEFSFTNLFGKSPLNLSTGSSFKQVYS